jgi:hypothetical protein
MSNAIRVPADEVGFRLDASTARRQFTLSLCAFLGFLALAAMTSLQPARTAADAPSSRHGQVSAPEFVAPPAGVVQLRQAMAAGAAVSAD